MSEFSPSISGAFMQRDGPARRVTGVEPCHRKLCFVATDRGFLRGLLLRLPDDPDCCFVKYTVVAQTG